MGSEAKEKKRVKAKREQKAARKKTSAPRKEKGQGTAKKKTKLPGQPKRLISAYFLWSTLRAGIRSRFTPVFIILIFKIFAS